MKFGVHTGLQETSFGELIPLWRDIESLGYDWISVWDHIYPTLGGGEGPNLDSIVALSALADATERVRVACLVFNATLRPPALLANAGAALDQLSGGRLEFGIGAGWCEAEQVEAGIDYPRDGVRVSMLEESLSAIRLLWGGGAVEFAGDHYHLDGARCEPHPVQDRVPIWVGGFRPRVLSMAGRLADGFNSAYVAPRLWQSLWARVLEAASKAGRTEGEVTPSVNVGIFLDGSIENASRRCREVMGEQVAMMGGHLMGSAEAMSQMVGEYREAGVERLNLVMRPPFDRRALEVFAEDVAPLFAEAR